jgi:hypothetical protein
MVVQPRSDDHLKLENQSHSHIGPINLFYRADLVTKTGFTTVYQQGIGDSPSQRLQGYDIGTIGNGDNYMSIIQTLIQSLTSFGDGQSPLGLRQIYALSLGRQYPLIPSVHLNPTPSFDKLHSQFKPYIS